MCERFCHGYQQAEIIAHIRFHVLFSGARTYARNDTLPFDNLTPLSILNATFIALLTLVSQLLFTSMPISQWKLRPKCSLSKLLWQARSVAAPFSRHPGFESHQIKIKIDLYRSGNRELMRKFSKLINSWLGNEQAMEQPCLYPSIIKAGNLLDPSLHSSYWSTGFLNISWLTSFKLQGREESWSHG